MPTNVSPEYKKAEAAYKKARDAQERLSLLKEMLRTIPKHKGTEHLQADIKSRIKTLTDELAGPKKGGARTGPVQAIRNEGAAQVALIGPPNAGKSALHQKLTGSHSEVGPYPFTTHAPIPGMLFYEDAPFQLIDLPPVSADFMEPWIVNALQPAHAALLVIDLGDTECVDHVAAILERLDEKRVTLSEQWPFPLDGSDPPVEEEGDELEDPFRVVLPTLLVATKFDQEASAGGVEILEELLGLKFAAVKTSVETGLGLDEIGPLLFRGLGVVRVYTKAPGKEPDTDKPYTLRRGDTVIDLARQVHKDFATSMKFARVWGSGQFEGQQVGSDHEVEDGDILELHM